MRSKRLAFLMVFTALLGAMLSCNLPGSETTIEPAEDEIATVVAGTMAVQEEKVITEVKPEETVKPEESATPELTPY